MMDSRTVLLELAYGSPRPLISPKTKTDAANPASAGAAPYTSMAYCAMHVRST